MNELKQYFYFSTILEEFFDPLEEEELAESFLSKKNIFAKENKELLNEWLQNYRTEFKNELKEHANYELDYSDRSLIMLDLLLSQSYIDRMIPTFESPYEIQRYFTKWVGYLGTYIMIYLKKKLHITPKIEYPLHTSSLQKNHQNIYPFILAIRKLSLDEHFSLYEYLGDIVADLSKEDYKIDYDYLDEQKIALRPYAVKWLFFDKNN